jgi:hypothetical protein
MHSASESATRTVPDTSRTVGLQFGCPIAGAAATTTGPCASWDSAAGDGRAATVGGTLAGSATYEAAHPAFSQIVWVERSAAHPDEDQVLRRALFADGRYLALTDNGYDAGILEPTLTSEIFATARAEAGSWPESISTNGLVGELIDLELGGSEPRSIRIENPSNLVLHRRCRVRRVCERRIAGRQGRGPVMGGFGRTFQALLPR